MPLYRITNITRGTQLGDKILLARDPESRRTGLLNHTELLPGEGLWIVPGGRIHTMGMKFPIDVLWMGRQLVIEFATMRPDEHWNLPNAESVIELPAGTRASTETQRGDRLKFEEA
jgi:uncharacterized protein